MRRVPESSSHTSLSPAAFLIAARIRGYVPQRQMLPDIAVSISPSLGLALVASSALADMIWADWQYPHWGTFSASQAAWTFLPAGVFPTASMVVIRFPTAADTGVMHDRVGQSST